jgi:hypothetical protein
LQGSGSVGSILVNEILNSQKFKLFVLAREDSSTAFPYVQVIDLMKILLNDNLFHSSSVHVLRTDYTVASLTSLLSSSHIDAVVSNLNGPALGAPQIALIDAAKVAGMKRFFHSEFGSDTTNPIVLEWVEFLREKKLHLKTKQGDGFEWTSLITGLWSVIFLYNVVASNKYLLGLQHDFLANFKEHKFYQWDNGDVPFSVINIATIGKGIVNILSSDCKQMHLYFIRHNYSESTLRCGEESNTRRGVDR